MFSYCFAGCWYCEKGITDPDTMLPSLPTMYTRYVTTSRHFMSWNLSVHICEISMMSCLTLRREKNAQSTQDRAVTNIVLLDLTGTGCGGWMVDAQCYSLVFNGGLPWAENKNNNILKSKVRINIFTIQVLIRVCKKNISTSICK
jgi:hypothetical protein